MKRYNKLDKEKLNEYGDSYGSYYDTDVLSYQDIYDPDFDPYAEDDEISVENVEMIDDMLQPDYETVGDASVDVDIDMDYDNMDMDYEDDTDLGDEYGIEVRGMEDIGEVLDAIEDEEVGMDYPEDDYDEYYVDESENVYEIEDDFMEYDDYEDSDDYFMESTNTEKKFRRMKLIKKAVEQLDEAVENEKAGELISVLQNEKFSNSDQRKKFIDIITSIFSIDDKDTRAFIKKLGDACTTIGEEMMAEPESDEGGEEEKDKEKPAEDKGKDDEKPADDGEKDKEKDKEGKEEMKEEIEMVNIDGKKFEQYKFPVKEEVEEKGKYKYKSASKLSTEKYRSMFSKEDE